MLETVNDYLSFIVMVVIVIWIISLLFAGLFRMDNIGNKRKISVLFDYYNFKD